MDPAPGDGHGMRYLIMPPKAHIQVDKTGADPKTEVCAGFGDNGVGINLE